ncbi:MAG: AAA family ATPase [Segniliparus sp.]|uniref:AAA family ATPase n=1 Tax=Segniliparus sp. TaxID=2804064 RepID=UPI003F32EA9B
MTVSRSEQRRSRSDSPRRKPEPPHAETGRKIVLTKASEIRPTRVRWLVDDWIVLGGLNIIGGREGMGKSTIAADFAAKATRGLLQGELYGQPRDVLYGASEDLRAMTIVPRLIAAGADIDRVMFVDIQTEDCTTGLTLPNDNHLLRERVEAIQPALLVLDAATSFMASWIDGKDDRQVRRYLEPLAALAQDTGCSILGVCHFGKRESTDTGKLIMGSIAWSQVPRSVLAVAKSCDDEDQIVVGNTKANLTRTAKNLAARIESRRVPADDGHAEVGAVVWLGETGLKVGDLLGEAITEGRSKIEEAAMFLTDHLLAHGPKVPKQDAIKAGHKAGFAERTLERAAKKAGVISEHIGFPRVAHWSLPDERGGTGGTELDQEQRPDNDTASVGGTEPDQLKQLFEDLFEARGETVGGTDDITSDLREHSENPKPTVQSRHTPSVGGTAQARSDGTDTTCPGCGRELTGKTKRCVSCALAKARASNDSDPDESTGIATEPRQTSERDAA